MYDVRSPGRSPRVTALDLFRNLLLPANKVANVMFSVVCVSHWVCLAAQVYDDRHATGEKPIVWATFRN